MGEREGNLQLDQRVEVLLVVLEMEENKDVEEECS